MPIDEALLVRHAQRGDASALEKLLFFYEKRVYNIALRYMGNEMDAYDMAQEALIKLYRRIRSFKGDSAFSSWVYRLTVNTCLDGLRKRNREPVSFDTADFEKFVGYDTGDTPEDRVLNIENAADIQRAISMLSDEHKQVIILRDVNGLSYDEVAYALDVSIGTVKSRLNRGRHRLKEILTHS